MADLNTKDVAFVLDIFYYLLLQIQLEGFDNDICLSG
jgi:hypothetical protein